MSPKRSISWMGPRVADARRRQRPALRGRLEEPLPCSGGRLADRAVERSPPGRAAVADPRRIPPRQHPPPGGRTPLDAAGGMGPGGGVVGCRHGRIPQPTSRHSEVLVALSRPTSCGGTWFPTRSWQRLRSSTASPSTPPTRTSPGSVNSGGRTRWVDFPVASRRPERLG